MSSYHKAQTDSQRKAAVVELLESAANGGAHPIPTGPRVTGALSAAEIRSALAVSTQEANRIINLAVDDASIVRVADPNSDPSTWRYTVA